MHKFEIHVKHTGFHTSFLFSIQYRQQMDQIDFQNTHILPNSPKQDNSDAVLSFFVDLPGGRTMSPDLLSSIYSISPNVISRPTTVISKSQNANLTSEQIENLVQLTVDGATQVSIIYAILFSNLGREIMNTAKFETARQNTIMATCCCNKNDIYVVGFILAS